LGAPAGNRVDDEHLGEAGQQRGRDPFLPRPVSLIHKNLADGFSQNIESVKSLFSG
jgi:hypothetical protein